MSGCGLPLGSGLGQEFLTSEGSEDGVETGAQKRNKLFGNPRA